MGQSTLPSLVGLVEVRRQGMVGVALHDLMPFSVFLEGSSPLPHYHHAIVKGLTMEGGRKEGSGAGVWEKQWDILDLTGGRRIYWWG